jgi:integrase
VVEMTARRGRRGTGTVYKDPDRQRYTGQITIDGKRYKVHARTKTEVQAKLSNLAKTGGRTTDKSSNITISQALDDFLNRDLASRDRAPSTVAVHTWAADTIKDRIGKKPAAKLTVRQVDDMLDQLADEGLSRSSLLKVRGTLAQALKYAVRRQDIVRNVAVGATIPPSATRTSKRTALSPADARQLLGALRLERNGAMFALSLRLGLRPGEAAGLFWSDIGDDAVNVTRAVRRSNGRAEVVDDLKTSAAKRTIALPTDLKEWLAEHRRAQIAERLAADQWVDERLVFTSPTGHVTDPAENRRQLAAVCGALTSTRRHSDPEAEPFPTLKPNELRHSCASLLSDAGVMNEEIADLLGHTTTRMVDQTYRHRLRPVVDVTTRVDWTAARVP